MYKLRWLVWDFLIFFLLPTLNGINVLLAISLVASHTFDILFWQFESSERQLQDRFKYARNVLGKMPVRENEAAVGDWENH